MAFAGVDLGAMAASLTLAPLLPQEMPPTNKVGRLGEESGKISSSGCMITSVAALQIGGILLVRVLVIRTLLL